MRKKCTEKDDKILTLRGRSKGATGYPAVPKKCPSKQHVQKKCTEEVDKRSTQGVDLNTVSYTERLHHLGIPSLELCRLYFDLIYCYKIVFGLVHVKFVYFFTPSTSSRTRGHPNTLFKSHCCTATRRNFVTERVINVWNQLPSTVIFSSLACFRWSIESVDFILNVIKLFCFYCQW